MANIERIAFAEAIGEDLLFKNGFERLSSPQQTILKVIYGQPLKGEELTYWSAFMGQGIYDELGFLTGVLEDVPYIPQEYADITIIAGRRSGKSSAISSFMLAYEAVCGGHKRFVGRRQTPVYLQVAQDLQTGKENLRQFILDWLESSPIGKEELKHYGSSAITADTIRLRDARITVGPPTIKLRSQAIACCAMDELCVWPKDRESANPDVEVQRAVEPALLQFFPFDKIIKTSTPMTEEGLLWQAAQIGTGGCLLPLDERATYKRTLVLSCPTAAMQNPALEREKGGSRLFLTEKRQKDAEAFPREYLARFAKSVKGFLSVALLQASVQQGRGASPPESGHFYVATMDPAFKRDAFAFCVGHLERGTFVQDYIHSWKGSRDEPLRPGAVLDEVAALAGQYGIRIITSDQYHSETLTELGMSRGLLIESQALTVDLKHKMWSDFNSLLLQRKLRLLDHPEMLDELMKLERTLTKFGNIQYAGSKDDLAMATALCAYKCLQMGEPRARSVSAVRPLTTVVRERIQQRVKAQMNGGEGGWWL